MLARLRAVGRLHLRGPLAFYVDFVIYSVLAAALVAINCRSWTWGAGCAGGVVFGSLIEYLAHRYLLHGPFWSANHERHHRHPQEHVTFPLVALPLFFFANFLLMPTSMFAGFVIWYVWFVVLHHALHHVDLAAYPRLRAYGAWHDLHHNGDYANFGITHPLFDIAFGTYRAINDEQKT